MLRRLHTRGVLLSRTLHGCGVAVQQLAQLRGVQVPRGFEASGVQVCFQQGQAGGEVPGVVVAEHARASGRVGEWASAASTASTVSVEWASG